MRQLVGNIEEFISLIQNRPALYNFNLPEFNDKNLTKKLWEEIAREFDTNVDYCKTKWGTLRVTFARQLRNEKKNAKSSSETLINDWYLKDKMAFMRDYMRERKKCKPSGKNIQNYNNDLEVKTETNLSEALLEMKSEPTSDENESLASLELCSNEDFLDVNKTTSEIVLFESSSVSNRIKNHIEKTSDTHPETNSRMKREASASQEVKALTFMKRRKNNRKQKPSLKRKENEEEADENPRLLKSQKIKKAQQEDLSLTPPNTSTKLDEDATMHFFKSILPDFNTLSGRRQRLVKQKLMENLNTLLDEQENES